MATIKVRAIDPVTFEPQYGNGQANFISDREAIIQIINTRLRLFQGEWFLNLLDGLPMFKLNSNVSAILGGPGSTTNLQVIINSISSRISQTIGVTRIISVNASYQNRHFKYSAIIETQFGSIAISNSPGTSATLVASTA